ncbi:hypothetical protein RRG08_037863 [Elysia crispata]|uniref:Uncharacterized protein n=1 Tax=Elysia crispata TaxID=231223 RepID=A0AAE1DI65_9GAST|nr:hypothetical protein RRG08_037863 [Elysia crispata]
MQFMRARTAVDALNTPTDGGLGRQAASAPVLNRRGRCRCRDKRRVRKRQTSTKFRIHLLSSPQCLVGVSEKGKTVRNGASTVSLWVTYKD